MQLVLLLALVAVAFAEDAKQSDAKADAKKEKRGLYSSLGYGGYGGYGGYSGYSSYGLGGLGLSTYSSLPLSINHGVSTVLTKEVAVPVPQPVAVPVEKHVPVPVKVLATPWFLQSRERSLTRV